MAESGAKTSSLVLLVLMVVSDFYVLQSCDCVIGKDGGRAVEGNQVRSDTTVVDASETDGKARTLLVGNARLEQTDDTLLALSDTEQQNL